MRQQQNIENTTNTYLSPIATILAGCQDQCSKPTQFYAEGFQSFDQALQERASEPLKDLSNIFHAKQSAIINTKESQLDINENSPTLLNTKSLAQYDSYLEDEVTEAQNENDQHKSNSKRKNKRKSKHAASKASKNQKTSDINKNAQVINRFSISTSSSFQSKMATNTTSDQSFCGPAESSQHNIDRQSFGQYGSFKLTKNSQKENKMTHQCLDSSRAATIKSMNSVNHKLGQAPERSNSSNDIMANNYLKKSKSAWVDHDQSIVVQKVSDNDQSIIQLPLPENHTDSNQTQFKLLKAKSTNLQSKQGQMRAHLSEKRDLEFYPSTIDNSSMMQPFANDGHQFEILESVCSSEISENALNQFDQEDYVHHQISKSHFDENQIQLLKNNVTSQKNFEDEEQEYQISQKEKLQIKPKQSSDRFIPQRVHSNCQAIFDISSVNQNELQVVQKQLKLIKKTSSTESQASATAAQQTVNNISIRANQINERGLTNIRLSETAQIQEVSNQQISPSQNDDSSEMPGVAMSSTMVNNFNQQLRSQLVNDQSIQIQAQRQANLGNRMGSSSVTQHSMSQYNNIFGGHNSYDQVVTQIGQNVQSSSNQSEQTTIEHSHMNIQTDNTSTQQIRNYARSRRKR